VSAFPDRVVIGMAPAARSADTGVMVDREQRTPFYGVVLILVALGAAMAVSYYGPTWVRVTVYILAVMGILVGGVMTFRDYSH